MKVSAYTAAANILADPERLSRLDLRAVLDD
jgi:hypothetical protein